MALKTTKELFDALPEEMTGAIGAFNVHNMEYTQGVIAAAEKENAPVILMIGEPMIPFAGLDMLTGICRYAAEAATVPVAIALDHGKDMANIKRFIELGLSVMIDASHHEFDKNVEITSEVVKKAHEAGLSVEGELGSLAGSEDGEAEMRELMTDPAMAEEFVRRTGVDILAVSIGNAHGLYKGTPRIDIDRLKAIRKRVQIPLVMHGGSDLPEEISKQAVAAGIRKFNVGTDLKYIFARTLKQTLSADPIPFQPPHVLAPARTAVEELTRQKIRLFGSSGFAELF